MKMLGSRHCKEMREARLRMYGHTAVRNDLGELVKDIVE
jgi:hypothetical protein